MDAARLQLTVSTAALCGEVSAVVDAAGLTADEFLAADIDELTTDEVRDLWLMVRGPLATAAR